MLYLLIKKKKNFLQSIKFINHTTILANFIFRNGQNVCLFWPYSKCYILNIFQQ